MLQDYEQKQYYNINKKPVFKDCSKYQVEMDEELPIDTFVIQVHAEIEDDDGRTVKGKNKDKSTLKKLFCNFCKWLISKSTTILQILVEKCKIYNPHCTNNNL